MKKVLNLIKSNLLIVIVMVVTILALPAMIYFSMQWTKSIHEEVAKRESDNVRAIDGITVNYEIPAVVPGEEAISIRATPNKVTTERIAEMRRQIFEQSESIREEAIDHNRAGKRLLIPELLPEPADESTRTRMRKDMVKRWPEAHANLIEDSRWGMPLAASTILSDLQRTKSDEVKRIISKRESQQLTPEEQEEIRQMLSQRRLDLYRSAASRISAYAAPNVFAGVVTWPEGDLPEFDQLWEWQYLYWIHQDIADAIVKANSDANGNWLPVFRAPVRHVLSVVVEPWKYTGAPPPGQDEVSVGEINDKGQVAPDYERSFTGRVSWPNAANPFYDLRYAEVDLVVASEQLPAVLRAFRSTNLMTITDMDIDEFDPAPGIENGFYYGGDNLVRVHLRIETLWLRAWMKPLMPPSVRAAMGIPPDPEAQPGESDEESGVSR